MCSKVFASLLLIVAASTPGLCQDKNDTKPPDKLITDFSYMQRYWGLEVKSFATNVYTDTGGGNVEIVILFEFERDLLSHEVLELRDAILAPDKDKQNQKKIRFVFQDRDNIIFSGTREFSVEGDIAGIRGDAIRIRTTVVREETIARAKKLMIRSLGP